VIHIHIYMNDRLQVYSYFLINICVDIYTNVYVYIDISIDVYMLTYMYIHIILFMHAKIFSYIHACIYGYIYIYIYTCIYIFLYSIVHIKHKYTSAYIYMNIYNLFEQTERAIGRMPSAASTPNGPPRTSRPS
jgi:hypothetical protein